MYDLHPFSGFCTELHQESAKLYCSSHIEGASDLTSHCEDAYKEVGARTTHGAKVESSDEAICNYMILFNRLPRYDRHFIL
jgi:hypothetical protein